MVRQPYKCLLDYTIVAREILQDSGIYKYKFLAEKEEIPFYIPTAC